MTFGVMNEFSIAIALVFDRTLMSFVGGLVGNWDFIGFILNNFSVINILDIYSAILAQLIFIEQWLERPFSFWIDLHN